MRSCVTASSSRTPWPGSCSTATRAPRLRSPIWTPCWQVVTAGDGQAALDAIERHRPALVVLDLMLPEIDGRADDTEDVIRHRMKVYDEETAPLAAVYRDRGLLHQVDGMGEMDEVSDRLRAVLATLQS